MRFGLSPVDVQGDGRLLNPAPLREGFGPSYDALRLLFCVSASLGYRRVGAPAAIGQLRAHAVCRAAFTLPVGRFWAGSAGSGVSHVLSFAARGCSCFAGCPRRLASAFLTWPWRGLRGESNPTFSNGVTRLDFARHLFSAGGSQGQGLAAIHPSVCYRAVDVRPIP